MNSNLVITIGRTFGSGGREIGKALAAELGMEYYDRGGHCIRTERRIV